MRFKKYIFFYFIFISIHISAQIGCPNNLADNIIIGPDSVITNQFYSQTFRSLTVNPLNPNHILIGTEGNGIFISRDGGLTWQWSMKGLKHSSQMGYGETWGATFNPIDTSIIYIAMTAAPGPILSNYPSAEGGVYVSTNGGLSWEQRNCGLDNGKACEIICNPQNSNNMLLTIEAGMPSWTPPPPQLYYKGGIYRSTNGSLSWTPATIPSGADSVGFWRIEWRNNILITFGLAFQNRPFGSLGFLKSTDDGVSWKYLPEPLAKRNIVEFAVSKDASKIVAVVRDSFFVYTTNNTGITWDKVRIPINAAVAYHPTNDNIIFFSNWNLLYKSYNGITTGDINSPNYKLIKTLPGYIEKIVFAPSNPNIMYIATRGYYVYKSVDGGETFTKMVRLWDVMKSSTTEVIDYSHFKETNSLIVYPNPTTDDVTIETSKLQHSPIIISIYDVLGKKVSEKSFLTNYSKNNFKLNISSLAQGFYILEINDGSRRIKTKFLKLKY